MSFLQGNTYLKPIQVLDDTGKVVKADKVVKGEFTIGDIYKYYGEGGDVQWNVQENAFIVPLTEDDTFSLKPDTTSEVQVRLLLDDGSVSGSLIEKHYVYRTKSTTRLTESGAGERTGELLQIKLLKELGTSGTGGGTTDYNYLDNKPSINGVELIGNKTTKDLGIVSEELDPTVPQYVKDITENDIVGWNNKATTNYVDTRVADLVNSAPETLDTLGEVAKAIEENASVVDALNSAIGNKADKTELADYVKNTDYATTDKGGVVKINGTYGIVFYNNDGEIGLTNCADEYILAKNGYYALRPQHIDLATKVGITTNTIPLTDDEKTNAQNWLGITDLVGDINTVLESVLGV